MKGAVEHCFRAAPGVNNRSLASDLRGQRYELFTRSTGRLPSCACGQGREGGLEQGEVLVEGNSLLGRHLELDFGQFLQRVEECQVLLA